MFLARHTQVVGMSSLSALATRIVGKFNADPDYKPHVNVDLDMKYGRIINRVLEPGDVMSTKVAHEGLVSYTGTVLCEGAPSAQVETAKLPNGVTAVAVDTASAVVHLGVYSGFGTRNETRDNAGVLQVMKHAWLGTTTRRTIIGGHREPAQCGVDIKVNVARDMLGINATCTRDKSALILDHMVQNIICPEFFEHELLHPKKLALRDTAAALGNAETVLLEQAHKLAYRGTGLGRSLYLAPHNASALNRDELVAFAEQNFKDSNNTVLVGIGMDLETVSGLAEEYLWSLEGGSVAAPTSQWTGGRECHVDTAGSRTSALYVIQGAAAGTHEALVLNLIRHIVGSNGSPAVYNGTNNSKLMSAASHAQQPHSVHCLNINYSDSGMFGLSVAADAEEVGDVLKSSVGVMRSLLTALSDEELEIAKTKLKHEIILQRDSSTGLMEIAATDSLLAISPNTAAQICSAVDSITAQDVVSMAKNISSSSPILVSIGNGEHVPLPRELH